MTLLTHLIRGAAVLCFTGSYGTAVAAETYRTIIVNSNQSEQQIHIPITSTSHRMITKEGVNVSDNGIEMDFPAETFVSLSFDKSTASSIIAAEADSMNQPTIKDGIISINDNRSHLLRIFTASGALISSQTGENLYVDMTILPSGTYLVTIDNNAFKIAL